MKKTKNKCNGCEFCKRVYFEGYYRYFYFDKIYFCELIHRIIDVNGGCEHRQRKKLRYDFSPQRFDGVIKDVEAIAEYLNDE